RKNQADSLTYQAEKQIKELDDKLPAADKEKIEGLIKDLREAIGQEDDEKIKTLTPELQQALYSVSANLYQQAEGAAQPTDPGTPGSDAGASSSSGGDDVIDAEFSESK
ncbi:Hsp70 family protein, partial [Moorena sp. SIO3I6]|uniref:Hsp70 family protein n=1 Tax=Moorena sp. SIO3I6 TaxID=2607831 RepID=UPI0013F816E0